MDNTELAKAYYKLLVAIDWNDEIFVSGLREGLNKFISNAFLAYHKGKNKYHKSHYVSVLALEKLKLNDPKGLIYEHIVPKTKYIQEPCEKLAKEGKLTVDFIEAKLDAYWKLATVTKEEDQRLDTHSMPKNWDGVDIFARYKSASIELVENPFFKNIQPKLKV